LNDHNVHNVHTFTTETLIKGANKEPKMTNFEPINSKQASEMFGISKLTWYRHNDSEKIPRPARLGKFLMWNKNELIQWAAAGMPNRKTWESIKEGWENESV